MEQVCHCSNFHRALMTGFKGTTSNLLRFLPLEARNTDVEEIVDPLQAYYFTVNTVDIPENASNSDLVSIMKKRDIEWLEHISSLNEFISDSSWSVCNARKDDTEIVPCVNSVLPLLR